jgi:anti-sigma regulatory factor (Ser/Thr protein kinase)
MARTPKAPAKQSPRSTAPRSSHAPHLHPDHDANPHCACCSAAEPEAKHCADAAGEPHVRLQILSQPRYLCGAREMVAAVAKRIGFSDLSCSQIALAIDEALANVMRHGYSDRPDGPIWLSVWPLSQQAAPRRKADPDETASRPAAENGKPASPSAPVGLRIVIEDEAKQIDPSSIKGRDLEDIRPGGLGVHIIRHVMDCVDYAKRDGKGMRLTLEKRL